MNNLTLDQNIEYPLSLFDRIGLGEMQSNRVSFLGIVLIAF